MEVAVMSDIRGLDKIRPSRHVICACRINLREDLYYSLDELVYTTLTTFRVLDSIRIGKCIANKWSIHQG